MNTQIEFLRALEDDLRHAAPQPPKGSRHPSRGRRRLIVAIAGVTSLAAAAAIALLIWARPASVHLGRSTRDPAASVAPSGTRGALGGGRPLGHTGEKLGSVLAFGPDDVWVGGLSTENGVVAPYLQRWNGSRWESVEVPMAGGIGLLAGVSSDDLWALVHEGTLIHWDGSTWREVSHPEPDLHWYISEVEAVASDDVWAVGGQFGSIYDGNSVADKPLIEHWDGSGWEIVEAPDPPTLRDDLSSIAVVSADDVWATGQASNRSEMDGIWNLLLHWDGLRWSVANAPNLGLVNVGLSIAPGPDGELWAFGTYAESFDGPFSTVFLRWDGTRWESSPGPVPETPGEALSLGHPVVITKDDAWSIGRSPERGAIIAHWDGISWSLVPVPGIDPGEATTGLSDIVATAADDIWAVGRYAAYGTNVQEPLLLHWDGVSWQRVMLPKA